MDDPIPIGARVTVRATHEDPVHLECSPYTVVTGVVDGPAYYVEHPYGVERRTFGPIPAARVRSGWAPQPS